MVVVLRRGGGTVLGFPDWFQAGVFFSSGRETGRSRTISPLSTVRTLVVKGAEQKE